MCKLSKAECLINLRGKKGKLSESGLKGAYALWENRQLEFNAIICVGHSVDQLVLPRRECFVKATKQGHTLSFEDAACLFHIVSDTRFQGTGSYHFT